MESYTYINDLQQGPHLPSDTIVVAHFPEWAWNMVNDFLYSTLGAEKFDAAVPYSDYLTGGDKQP